MAKTSTETREQINARVLATVTPVDHVISAMKARMTKPWPKLAGPMPTDQQLMAAAMFSKSTAGAEAGFMAMQLRDAGCSILQLGQAFNCGPAHNHTRDHSGRVWHHFNRGKLGTGTFTLTFTPKGEAALAKALAAVTAGQVEGAVKPPKAPAKPKGKSKPKGKGRGPVTETPTSEQPTVNEGQHAMIDETVNQQQPVEVEPVETETVTTSDLAALAAHFNQG